MFFVTKPENQASKLYKYGDADDRCRDVHAILGPRLWRVWSNFCTPCAHRFDECMRRPSKCLRKTLGTLLMGNQLYGNLEWTFKWLKILLILLVCICMIAVKAGGVWSHRKTQVGDADIASTAGPNKIYSSKLLVVCCSSRANCSRFSNRSRV